MRAMKRFTWVLMVCAISLNLKSAYADFADPPAPLKLNKQIDLGDKKLKGKPFLEVMDTQIKPLFDADENSKFVLAEKDTIKQGMANFEDKLRAVNDRPYARALSYFAEGEEGFNQLIEALQPGTKYDPKTFRNVVFGKMKGLQLIRPQTDREKDENFDPTKMAASTSAALIALASGSGTTIILDKQNYMYGLGYRKGGALNDEKTGRNFAASLGHKSLDPSDKFYLSELEAYLTDPGTKDPSPFFRMALKLFTKTDVDGYNALIPLAQTVLADCFTIYIAELDRSLMSDLAKHPWENDLFEVTLLAAYSAKAGKVASRNGLVSGHLVAYYGQGPTGGGIGDTRRERRKLQSDISRLTKTHHNDTVSKLEKLIGAEADTDVIMGLMLHLNNRDKKAQAQVKDNADALIETTALFARHLFDDADALTQDLIN